MLVTITARLSALLKSKELDELHVKLQSGSFLVCIFFMLSSINLLTFVCSTAFIHG